MKKGEGAGASGMEQGRAESAEQVGRRLRALERWSRAELLAGLARRLVSEMTDPPDLVRQIDEVVTDLVAAVDARDVPGIERAAQVIEGEDEIDSLMTKGSFFGSEQAEYRYGLVLEAAGSAIATLYANDLVHDVPGIFREELVSAGEDYVSAAERGGVLDEVTAYLLLE